MPRPLSRLGVNVKHRMSMLRNLVSSLVQHERIETTLARAKCTARMADRMVALAKTGTPAARIRVAGFVRGPPNVAKLFDELGPRYRERNGGFTRVLRTRFRKGDGAQMTFLEFVDRPGELRPAKATRGQRIQGAEPAAAAAAPITATPSGPQ